MARHKNQTDLEADCEAGPQEQPYPVLPSPRILSDSCRVFQNYQVAPESHDILTGHVLESRDESRHSLESRDTLTHHGLESCDDSHHSLESRDAVCCEAVTTSTDSGIGTITSSITDTLSNMTISSSERHQMPSTDQETRNSFGDSMKWQSFTAQNRPRTEGVHSWSAGVGMVAPPGEQWLLQQDEDGDTGLHLALIHHNLLCIAAFLQSMTTSTLLHLTNTLCQTPLHLAVLRRIPKVVRLLMTRGAPIDVHDRNGNTPLHLACRDGDLDTVRELTLPLTTEEVKGCPYTFQQSTIPPNADVRNFRGESCLHLAAAGGHMDIVKYLIESPVSADVNFPDGRSGRTILHHVVESRDMGLLSFLLKHKNVFGLDVDAQTYCGNTALSLALGRKYHDVAEFLYLAGADTSVALQAAQQDPDEEEVSDLESCSDVSSECSMESEDFDERYYDDFCVQGRPLMRT